MSWRELPLPDGVDAIVDEIAAQAHRVHKVVGPGFREAVYRRCLAHALAGQGHRVDEHVPLSVQFDGLLLPRAGEVDLVVDGQVVVETKAREAFHPSHRAQLLSYLRAGNYAAGLLLNFHASLLFKHGYERMVHPQFLEWI